MKSTPEDRLLLGKSFRFRSDLSPAECVTQIEQMSTHSTGNERWRGEVQPSRSMEWLYTFEINLNELSYRPVLIEGIIKQDATGTGSVVSGIARYASTYGSFSTINDRFRSVMAFLLVGLLLYTTAGTITVGGLNTYWLNLLGVVGVAGGLVAYLASSDKHIQASIELLDIQLKAQHPQPAPDMLGLGWLDRVLLARVFTFRSDLSPAACAERIRELTSQTEDEGIWIGAANPVADAGENSHWFDLKLRRRAAMQDGNTTNARIRGLIEPGDALGGSVIIGVLRSNPSIWMQVVILGVLLLLMLILLPVAASEMGGWYLVCILLPVLAFVGTGLWTAWADRSRTLKRLERSLQTSYRAQKKKVGGV